MRIKVDDKTTITQYGDVEVTVKKIEDQETEIVDTHQQSNKDLASIAYAKRADNDKGARYHANFVEEDGIKFGIAVTRSI